MDRGENKNFPCTKYIIYTSFVWFELIINRVTAGFNNILIQKMSWRELKRDDTEKKTF